MKLFLASILFTSLIVLLSACGSDAPNAQIQMPPPAPSPPPDPEPPAPIPSVISSSPEYNQIGILPTRAIRLNFNAPMNQASVQAAFSATSDAPIVVSPASASEAEASAQVIPPPILGPQPIAGSFAWPNNRTLTFTPTYPMPLGSWITVKLNQTAKDTSNRPLTLAFEIKFRILRQFSTALPSNAALDGQVSKYGLDETVFNGAFIRIGDRVRNPESSYGFLSFDLSGLPSGAQVTKATLNYKLLTISGDPVAALGGLAAYGVNYGDSLDGSDYFAESENWCGENPSHFLYRCPLAHVPVMGWNRVKVTPAVQYDMANQVSNGRRSQFRLGFYFVWGNEGIEDFIDIAPAEHPDPLARPFLQLIYLAP